MNLSRYGKVTRVSNAVAAGITVITTSSVDMQGFDQVEFLISFGSIVATALTSVRAQQSDDDVTYADLAGTSIVVSDTDDNKVVVLEINEPTKRYVRLVVARAIANATVDGIIAIQTRANIEPVTHDATTVAGSEFHHAPAEGTA